MPRRWWTPAVSTKPAAGALSLWRGPALGGLQSPHLQAIADELEERRLVILERRIEVDLQLERHAEVVPELGPLVATHPYRERLRRLQMLALHGSGRHAEALEAYRHTRRKLADELGVEPGPELQLLHELLLRGGLDAAGLVRPITAEAAERVTAGASQPPQPPRSELAGVVPAQLPGAPSLFVGRVLDGAQDGDVEALWCHSQ